MNVKRSRLLTRGVVNISIAHTSVSFLNAIDMYKLKSQHEKSLPNLSSKDMRIMKMYHYLIDEISDPRISDWPLMSNPFGCEPFVISDDSMSLSMARWVWWILILKIIELTDTVIFILRKKYNQISFLHVYHHTATLFLAWISCKYAPGGMWTFIMMPNCAIHVIMYTYYLCACLGPKMQKTITPWKKYITRLQLIQFAIMMVHTFQALLPSCEPTRKPLAYIYMSQIVLMFYMFLDYYRKSYLRKKLE
ncbi:elongation of very long chain fatty acids protein AAEL008004 isoform X2 [Monomorium pharaonis]|uniref:elongation of very long chain fatty acids protein AAEL008004 isoform X2 n=1 Tax=Monomorium pharaonis TaxID=307658 RepID=UPI00102E14EB|nr:elongation of very long chain fatty acids protein AAEL008004 isoform X2 [Monomorium pharaonis]